MSIEETFAEIYPTFLRTFGNELQKITGNPSTVMAAALAAFIDLIQKSQQLDSPCDSNLLIEFLIKYSLQVLDLRPEIAEQLSSLNFDPGHEQQKILN